MLTRKQIGQLRNSIIRNIRHGITKDSLKSGEQKLKEGSPTGVASLFDCYSVCFRPSAVRGHAWEQFYRIPRSRLEVAIVIIQLTI